MKNRDKDRFDELRKQAEELLALQAGEDSGGSGPEIPAQQQQDILELVHELSIHQTELEIQNEELRRAQDEISSLKQEFEDLYEFAPCGYVTLNAEGKVTRINLTGAAMLGTPRRLLTRTGLSSFINDESREDYIDAVGRAATTGGPETAELKLEQVGERPLWVQAVISADLEEKKVKQYRITLSDITQRKAAETELNRALEEKDFLMSELNHRVKNNLAMVGSLVSLKQQELKGTADISDLRRRIHSIGLVHEKLYTGGEVTRVDCRPYVQELLETLFSAFSNYRVEIENRIDPVTLPAKLITTLGLIINELATNAVKHGFNPEEKNRFTVDLTKNGKKLCLRIACSGGPLPEDISSSQGGSFGLVLVSELVRQLDGSLDVKRRPSPEFTITFPGRAAMPKNGSGGF